jgi:hypothetical protein
MLTWETVKAVAYLDEYTYTITQLIEGDEAGDWGVEIDGPDFDDDSTVCKSIEEAKEYCENTAAEMQPEEE